MNSFYGFPPPPTQSERNSDTPANGKAMSDFDRDCGRCSLIRISEPEVGAYYLVVIAPNRAFVHLSTFSSKGGIDSIEYILT